VVEALPGVGKRMPDCKLICKPDTRLAAVGRRRRLCSSVQLQPVPSSSELATDRAQANASPATVRTRYASLNVNTVSGGYFACLRT
jgi:hypothetical protein